MIVLSLFFQLNVYRPVCQFMGIDVSTDFSYCVDAVEADEIAASESKASKETIDFKEIKRVDHILASLQRKVIYTCLNIVLHAPLFLTIRFVSSLKESIRGLTDLTIFAGVECLMEICLYEKYLMQKICRKTILHEKSQFLKKRFLCLDEDLNSSSSFAILIGIVMEKIICIYLTSFTGEYENIVKKRALLILKCCLFYFLQLPPTPPPPSFPEGYTPPSTAEGEKGTENQQAEPQPATVDPIIDQGPSKRMKL